MVRLQYRLFLVLTYWQDFLAVLQRPADFLRHLTFLGILYLKYRKETYGFSLTLPFALNPH